MGVKGCPNKFGVCPLTPGNIHRAIAARQLYAKQPLNTLLQLAYHGISNYWHYHTAS